MPSKLSVLPAETDVVLQPVLTEEGLHPEVVLMATSKFSLTEVSDKPWAEGSVPSHPWLLGPYSAYTTLAAACSYFCLGTWLAPIELAACRAQNHFPELLPRLSLHPYRAVLHSCWISCDYVTHPFLLTVQVPLIIFSYHMIFIILLLVLKPSSCYPFCLLQGFNFAELWFS